MVIAIIGILGAAVMAAIDPIGQTQKAADGRRKSDLRQIQTALELYRSDYGYYPAASDVSGSLTKDGTIYMKSIPKDPKGTNYLYRPDGTLGSYFLYSCGENDNSPDVKSGSVTGLSCSKALYFEVTSP